MLTAAPAAKTPIEEAGHALELANDVVTELSARRDKFLLAGDMNTVAAIERDLDAATSHAKRCADRIKLIEAQAERASRARQAKELRALVTRLESKLAKRDQLANEFEKQLADVVCTFHALVELGDEVTAAWPNAAAGDAVEAIATGPALQRAVAAELFRLSGVEFVGGGITHRGPPSFPGSAPLSPLTPSRSAIDPLSTRLVAASAYASARMRAVLPEEKAHG